MNTGLNVAQSYEEMTNTMNEQKEVELASSRGVSNYRVQSGEYQEDKIRGILTADTRELAEIATKEKVSLEDVEEIKKRTFVYLRACEETATFPSNIGLAHSLGYTDRALRHWRNKKPNTETAQWLEMFNELCVDVLNQSALKNYSNSIVAIFMNKAHYGYRETNELVLTPNTQDIDDETAISAEEIRKRYMVEGGN